MGKGGTRFVGEAVGHRSGREKSTYTNKELKKNMDKYLETGVHPDMEEARAMSTERNVYALPERDPNRQHVFIEAPVGPGKMVIELFEDVLPTTAATFRNRCCHGSSSWLKDSPIHKIQSGYAVYGGLESRAKSPAHAMRRSNRLRHASYGAVSVATDGTDFAISLGRSLKLDDDHQVVGRIHTGREVLEQLNAMPTSSLDDSPLTSVTITRCGTCSPDGTYDSFDDAETSSGKKLSAAETEEMLATEAEETKESVRDAVLSGLNKRKAGMQPGGPGPKAARGMMGGGVLADISDSDDSGNSQDSG